MEDINALGVSIIIFALGIGTLSYLGGAYSQERDCNTLLGEVQKAQTLECSELQIQDLCNRALRSYIDAVFSEQDTFTKEEWEMERPYIVRE